MRVRGLLLVAALMLPALASAQKPVLLQLRPRIGDTVWMRLEQETIMAGKRADSKAQPATMGTRMITFSRAIIESGVATSTTILGVTDSVLVTTLDQNGQGPAPARQKQARAQQPMRVHIAPDGSIGMSADGSTPPKGMSRAASLIPATFPLKPVSVGDKWTREAPLPAGTTQFGSSIVGWVEATFRLDSLTRGGDLAWISMHGKLHPDPAGPKTDGIATVDDGTVEGYMALDRDRGWLLESKFVILAHSTLRQLLGITAQPTTFEIHLTQTLKTIR
jgi:hypothetical protein